MPIQLTPQTPAAEPKADPPAAPFVFPAPEPTVIRFRKSGILHLIAPGSKLGDEVACAIEGDGWCLLCYSHAGRSGHHQSDCPLVIDALEHGKTAEQVREDA
jgi:hypothetical protein